MIANLRMSGGRLKIGATRNYFGESREFVVSTHPPKRETDGWTRKSRRLCLTTHRTTYLCDSVGWFATCRLFCTLKTPGTPLALILAVSLSACESTTPYSSTWPFCTEMRIGLAGSMAYLFSVG